MRFVIFRKADAETEAEAGPAAPAIPSIWKR